MDWFKDTEDFLQRMESEDSSEKETQSFKEEPLDDDLLSLQEWDRRVKRRIDATSSLFDKRVQKAQSTIQHKINVNRKRDMWGLDHSGGDGTTEFPIGVVCPSHSNTSDLKERPEPIATNANVPLSIQLENRDESVVVDVALSSTTISSEIRPIDHSTTTKTTSSIEHKQKPSRSNVMLFEGIVFFFLNFSSLCRDRIKIMTGIVSNKGGTVLSSLSDQVTHIITAENLSILKIKDVLSRTTEYNIDHHLDRGVRVHTTEWISKSVNNHQLCDEYMYRIFPIDFDSQSSSLNSQSLQVAEPVQKPKIKWESRFACQKPGPDKASPHPNKDITDELQRLLVIYQQTGEAWRTVAYRKAIAAIQRYPKRIQNGEEAIKIHGIGKGIADKINDFLLHGNINKLSNLQENKKIQAIQQFCKIWGVGLSTAEKWYAQGLRTLEDVKQKAQLNSQQLIGMRYYEDFQHRIPRSEVEKIVSVVANVALSIRSSLEIIPCGSYRRGKSDSGDVDILITDRANDDVELDWLGLLPEICDRLTKHDSNMNPVDEENSSPFLSAHLSTAKREGSGEMANYMGVCKLVESQYYRRIDIKIYKPEHFPFAVLYFTGSDHFNRSMRLLASKKGLSLSDKCLRHVIRCNRVKVHEGKEIPCYTEQAIFAALNLEYREPHERDI